MNLEEILEYPYDPWLLLGVNQDADDKDVERAWRRAGAPADGILFDAYQLLHDEHSRTRHRLLGPKPFTSATDAAGALKRKTRYVGPGKWYEFIARYRPR